MTDDKEEGREEPERLSASGVTDDKEEGREEPKRLSALMTALNWGYDKAVNGIPNFDRAEDLANDYLAKARSPDEAIDRLILWQIGKAGTAGFVSGLGGIITLPVAIPANLMSVLWIQIRMIAAIAHIKGYDIRSDQVKTLVLTCLVGTSTTDILKDFGINVGSRFGQKAIKGISGAILTRINRAVGFRLIAKAGPTAAVNLSKIVPFVGGLVGGTVDAFVTRAIGATAKSIFR
jgi:uncharacterized protein (DUF697 family)